MTEVFNRSQEGDNRRHLRSNMPSSEVILWAKLKGRQLAGCKFRRQYSVGSFVIDFYSPEVKLGIELDGDSHFQEGARAYDEKRTEFISSFGIRVLRFLNADIDASLDGVLEAIGLAVLESSAAIGDSQPLGPTPPGPPFSRGGKEKNAGPTRASGRRPRRRGHESSPEAAPHVPAVERAGDRSRQSLSPPLEGGARGGEPQRKPSPSSSQHATEDLPRPRNTTDERRSSP
jgi:very-short-patch-repair endonuclease